jgi:predicted nucleic acid-binding protein
MAPEDKLFIDASVLIAAAASPTGGSALVMEFCKARKATPLVSRLVLIEAERNIRKKFEESVLVHYYDMLAELDPQVLPTPEQREIEAAAEVIRPKDAHVLAAARNGEASHLITLDRKHILTDEVRQTIRPILACTPGEYLDHLLASLKP